MINERITKQMTVNELLNRWPGAIQVFFQHKMACVGCTMASFDTLEDVSRTYHLDPVKFVSDLEKTIQKDQNQTVQPNER